MLLNLPPLSAKARLKMDIKAAETVVIAIATYYICYVPVILFSIWRRNKEDRISSVWLPFMTSFFVFLSSTLNPIIYVSRNRRSRSALRQFFKDPCGVSEYQEQPIRNTQQRKENLQFEREEVKDCTDTGTSFRPDVNPGRETRRSNASYIQNGRSSRVWPCGLNGGTTKNYDSYPDADVDFDANAATAAAYDDNHELNVVKVPREERTIIATTWANKMPLLGSPDDDAEFKTDAEIEAYTDADVRAEARVLLLLPLRRRPMIMALMMTMMRQIA